MTNVKSQVLSENISKNATKEPTNQIGTNAYYHCKTLEDRGYEINGKLGKGSFAVVVKAYSKTRNRLVAVKIVSKTHATQDYLNKFLVREIDIIKVVRHRNIIKCLEIVETTKHAYIIMKVAENGDLLRVIKREKNIDEIRACRWFHHLVDGIDYCHSKGIAHRDLKCENLLLNRHNVLKITDFGFARTNLPPCKQEGNYQKTVVRSSTYCGSYAYACPEILNSTPYEAYLSDMWSMGIILFVMLYGRFPFDTSKPKEYARIVTQPPYFFSQPQVSNSCKSLILSILKPEEDRIYIPEVRSNVWYCSKHNDPVEDEKAPLKMKESFHKPESGKAVRSVFDSSLMNTSS